MKKAAVPSILVVLVLLALGVIAEAQQPAKIPRIGYLSNTDAATDSARAEGIRLAAMWMSSRRTHESSYFLMTVLLPDQRETCCHSWHGIMPSHCFGMRPSLRHNAPGSLSLAPNRQEFLSPGSASRRVVPWGTVSSWVKGAE